MAWESLERFSDRRVLDRFRSGTGFLLKAPIAVAAGKVVTVSVKSQAALTYSGGTPTTSTVKNVRFHACSRAKSGRATVFAGGFRLDGPGCVDLEVRQRGSKIVWRRTVSFGMGDTCDFDQTVTHVASDSVGCANANGPRGGPDRIPIGDFAAVNNVDFYADPAQTARNRDPRNGYYGFKTPLAVRQGKTVTISVDPTDRDWVELNASGARKADSLTLTACPPGDDNRNHNADQRRWSAWPGGFVLKRPGCVRLLARERGSPVVQRGVVSFGMGDACSGAIKTALFTTFGAAADPPPVRHCRERIESGRGPVPFRQRGSTVVGPVALGTQHFADPDDFKQYFNRRTKIYGIKAGASVKAGRVVTLSIAAPGRDVADLVYAPWVDEESPPVPGDVVRFQSCKRDQRAFSYDGVVGASTAYSGGWELKEPACVPVEVRQRGSRRVWRETISFGMGDACD